MIGPNTSLAYFSRFALVAPEAVRRARGAHVRVSEKIVRAENELCARSSYSFPLFRIDPDGRAKSKRKALQNTHFFSDKPEGQEQPPDAVAHGSRTLTLTKCS